MIDVPELSRAALARIAKAKAEAEAYRRERFAEANELCRETLRENDGCFNLDVGGWGLAKEEARSIYEDGRSTATLHYFNAMAEECLSVALPNVQRFIELLDAVASKAQQMFGGGSEGVEIRKKQWEAEAWGRVAANDDPTKPEQTDHQAPPPGQSRSQEGQSLKNRDEGIASDPFSVPTIDARIAVDVCRIQAAWLDWNAESMEGDFNTKIVETLVETLDAHARAYLAVVNSESLLTQYARRLRRVGSALIENSERRSFLSDPYSEEQLRKLATSEGKYIRRKHLLTAEEQEVEICNSVERIRIELQSKAMEWHAWRNQMLIRIETRFEARYRYWAAEAIERVHAVARSAAPSLEFDSVNPKARESVPQEPEIPKKRGRPTRFTQQQLVAANRMKQAGKPNNEIAKILYCTSTPTPAQRRSVPTSLKYHFVSKK
jgi:hypothetical protein